MELPELFLERMKRLLGEEFDAFLSSFDMPRTSGLRVNPMKMTDDAFEACSPFPVRRIPWAEHGYFFEADAHPAQHPYYAAGLYYIQEPSAMTPADRLPIREGDRVLDLCAAPGGKSTQLAGRLNGSGFLVSNEVNQSRSRALLRNLELFGTKNCFVTNESADRLLLHYPAYFDKILVDAPCSGEGMFRKNQEAAETWSMQKIEECAGIQKGLIDAAYHMLKCGGYLMYSTCTFAPEEDEAIAAYALAAYPDLHLEEIQMTEGFSGGIPHALDMAKGYTAADITASGRTEEEIRGMLKRCVRMFPHKIEGEGHFLALFRKGGTAESGNAAEAPVLGLPRQKRLKKVKKTRSADEPLFLEFAELCGISLPQGTVERKGDKLYLLAEENKAAPALRFLRNGLFLGELKKNRFEPSESFALALKKEDCEKSINISREDAERFLRGESFPAGNLEPGWYLICFEDLPLGWCKYVSGMLKNKYPAAWRQN